MWKKTVSILFLLVLIDSSVHADNGFTHTAKIKIGGENQYKAVRLTPQIYNASHANLADLLIKDASGENVPYFINTSENTSGSRKASFFVETVIPGFSIEKGNRRTDIVIEGLKNLRLCDVTIDTDSMFKRMARTADGTQKEIYNLLLNGASYTDTTIPLHRHISRDAAYMITIADGDDKPIKINGVIVRYYADDIVFGGKTGEIYTLEFGRDAVNTPPVYDIERYKNDILRGPMDKVAIGEINYVYAAEIVSAEKIPDAERDYKVVFNIVIVIVTLLLGIVILVTLKRK
jgi:hypothetical protein